MFTTFTTEVLVFFALGLLLGSAVLGAPILWALARGIGRIPNARYGNCFVICVIASVIVIAAMQVINLDLTQVSLTTIVFANLVVSGIAFIAVGKLVWKCSLLQAVKANILWIIAYAILMGYALNKLSM